MDELDKLIDADKDEEVEKYLMSKIPNYDKVKADTEAEVIEEVIKGVNESEAAYQLINQQDK